MAHQIVDDHQIAVVLERLAATHRRRHLVDRYQREAADLTIHRHRREIRGQLKVIEVKGMAA